MDGDTGPFADPKRAQALGHSTRSAILELLAAEQALTPSSLSEKLGVKPGNASYHVDVLVSCGAVELDSGSGQQEVRLPRPLREATPRPKKRWLDSSGSMRDDVSAAQLKSLIEMAAHLRPRQPPAPS